jgi:superkiller protein 3
MKFLLNVFLLFLIVFYSCNNARDYKNLAEKYLQENKYEQALNSINVAIKLAPDSVSYYTFRIKLYEVRCLYKEEIADLDKIIELSKGINRNSLNAYHQRASTFINIGRYKEALSDINYFIDNRDNDYGLSEAFINKAIILYKMGDYKNSMEYYESAQKENKGKDKSIESQILIGLAYLSDSPEKTLNLLNKAIELDSISGIPYIARISIFMNQGKINEAFNDAKMAFSIIPEDATLNYNIAQLYANYLNNNDSAIKYFERAIKFSPQSPNNSEIYMNIGVINYNSGRYENALNYYKKSEEINTENDLLYYNLASLLSDLNRNTEALEKINKAIKLNPNDAEFFNLKGTFFLIQSSLDSAEQQFKRAIEIDPKFAGAFYNLGYLFGEKMDHVQSIKYYDQAVLLNFNIEATLVNRALQKIKINKIESACDDFKRALELGRTDIIPTMEKYCK